MNWTDLDGLPPAAYNQQFIQKLAQDPEAIRMVGDNFVRDRLREDMVFNAILPQTPVTPDRLQVALETDTMYEVIHLDPNAAASIVDFRGPGRGQIVRAPRVALGFHMLKSDEYEVVEQELLVYPYPIVRLVHEYSVKAIGDQHDLYMLQNSQRAVDFVDGNAAYKGEFGGGTIQGRDAAGGAYPGAATRGVLNSYSIVALKKQLSNRIQPSVMALTKFDHDDIDAMQIFEQGESLRSQVFVEGYRQPTISGLRMVVTTKSDIFRPGNVWAFAAPEYVGKNRILDYGGNAYKLFIDRRSNVITWHVYVNVGALIANVGNIAKLELYNAAYITAQNGLVAGSGDKIKNANNITDSDLFGNRNLVETGGRFPTIRQF